MPYKRALVTGAAGFIGSHLTEELVRRGANVRALVRYNALGSRGNLEHLPPDILRAVEVVAGDVRDPFFVDRVTEETDVVFHLAALIAIPYSYVAPQSYVDTNISGTLHVLEAARRHGVHRVVHTSTSETYGTATYTPIDECHPLQAQSPYAASKVGADKLAESYFRSFDVPVAILRPFNTFGPRQSARAVIPTIVSQALSRNQIELGSVEPVRDLTYVEDTVRGFIAIAEAPNVNGEVINLGTGRGVTIGSIAETVLTLLGRQIPIVSADERVRPEMSEVFTLIADNKRAETLLGWTPRVSLEQGLERVVEWVRSNPSVFRTGEYAV